MHSTLPRPQQAAPGNRVQRRAQKAAFRAHARAEARRDGGELILTDLSALFDRDANGRLIDTPGETIIARAVAGAEKQIGRTMPPALREKYAAVLRANLMNIERTSIGLAPVSGAVAPTDEQEEEARRLRDELLPMTREIAASLRRAGLADDYLPDGDPVAQHLVPPGTAGTPDQKLQEALRANRFTAADVAGVMVYEATGQVPGWHGDVVLSREIPPFSNAYGTPVAAPCRTRDEAVKAAAGTLASLLLAAEGEDA